MSPVRVKICGITTPDDARAAVSAGADYVGVIFAESPRRVDLARAQEIRAAVRRHAGAACFGPADRRRGPPGRRFGGVNLVQLHGRESPSYCDDVRARTASP
jgi:phosphoribosylanthranilate isomerase